MATVRKGTRFRSSYADSNALWEVERVGGEVAHCVIVDEQFTLDDGRVIPGDYAGVRKPFYVHDVLAILHREQAILARMDVNAEFFASLQPGSTVHYNNGFGEYVRCTVVVADGSHRDGELSQYAAGTHVLLPVALVGGGWRIHDLPRTILTDDGPVLRSCYFADRIREGSSWRPDHGCVFEYDPAAMLRKYPKVGDPRRLQPFSLDPADNVVDQRGVAA